jgi:hypothetical protein
VGHQSSRCPLSLRMRESLLARDESDSQRAISGVTDAVNRLTKPRNSGWSSDTRSQKLARTWDRGSSRSLSGPIQVIAFSVHLITTGCISDV